MMKRRHICILCFLLSLTICVAGCALTAEQPPLTILQDSCTTTSEIVTSTTTEQTSVETTTTQTAPQISPNVIGIYIPAANGTSARTRITEFVSTRVAKKDIDCFEIFASQKAMLTGSSFASIWNQAWAEYPHTEGTKIGFHITFSLANGQEVSKQLRKPSDAASFFDYLEIYMYDDIHQAPGVWYTHLEDKDMQENTIISSIKLTSGSKISQVGDITLTAFLYQGDQCFDAQGQYFGTVLESITIRAA